MKMAYRGINTGKVKNGQVYDVTIDQEGTRVSVSGEGFNYTFKYKTKDRLQRDWEGGRN